MILVHTCEQASDGGELANAVGAGAVTRGDVTELGPVLTGESEDRRSTDVITLFDSTGLAIQDLAIALATMERAAEIDGVQTVDLSDTK